MSGFIRNHEQYFDPTAGAALSSVERGEKMSIVVGDVVKFTKPGTNIVDMPFAVLAITGLTFTGLRLYDTEVPGSVQVICEGLKYAQPDKLEWFNSYKCDVGFVRSMTTKEFNSLRDAVAHVLQFDTPPEVVEKTEPPYIPEDVPSPVTDDIIKEAAEQAKDLIKAQTEAEIYKGLYTELLSKCMGAAG